MLTSFGVNAYFVRSKRSLRSKWHDLGLVLCFHHSHTCITFSFDNGRSPPLFVPHLLNPKIEYLYKDRATLHKHLVQTCRLNLIQLLKALGVEGDLAVERGEERGDRLLLSERNVWNWHSHKIVITYCKSIESRS